MEQYDPEHLAEAEQRAAVALSALDRQQIVAKLCEKEGLAYASLTEDQLGPMLVTYQHKRIGEVHTDTPSALHGWHARPYLPDGTLGEGTGQVYGTARAAAASLIPGHAEAQPNAESSG